MPAAPRGKEGWAGAARATQARHSCRQGPRGRAREWRTGAAGRATPQCRRRLRGGEGRCVGAPASLVITLLILARAPPRPGCRHPRALARARGCLDASRMQEDARTPRARHPRAPASSRPCVRACAAQTWPRHCCTGAGRAVVGGPTAAQPAPAAVFPPPLPSRCRRGGGRWVGSSVGSSDLSGGQEVRLALAVVEPAPPRQPPSPPLAFPPLRERESWGGAEGSEREEERRKRCRELEKKERTGGVGGAGGRERVDRSVGVRDDTPHRPS